MGRASLTVKSVISGSETAPMERMRLTVTMVVILLIEIFAITYGNPNETFG